MKDRIKITSISVSYEGEKGVYPWEFKNSREFNQGLKEYPFDEIKWLFLSFDSKKEGVSNFTVRLGEKPGLWNVLSVEVKDGKKEEVVKISFKCTVPKEFIFELEKQINKYLFPYEEEGPEAQLMM